MRVVATFIFSLLFLTSFSREELANGNTAAKEIKPLTPQELAHKLTAPYKTEMDKVRSIFSWIADNISYNVRPSFNRNAPPVYDDPNDTAALKPLSERVAEGVLIKRVAFCDGYARLFKTLCDYSGITSELITGYGKTSNKKRTDLNFRSNHRWNAVMIDSTWHLLDVTWASGYISSASSDFVRRMDDKYFLSPPEVFIKDHYPEDVKWTLLPSPPAFKDYLNAPL
jgi:transglutaminase/protease-like cytokinesis protein 3